MTGRGSSLQYRSLAASKRRVVENLVKIMKNQEYCNFQRISRTNLMRY